MKTLNTLEKILTLTGAFLIAGSIALKDANDIGINADDSDANANKGKAVSITQLVDNIAADAFAVEPALADVDSEYEKSKTYAKAMRLMREGDSGGAISEIEGLVDIDPFNKKYVDTLLKFYNKTMWYGNLCDFFTPFVEINKEDLMKKENKEIKQTIAQGLYDIATEAMYEYIPNTCKENKREPMYSEYEYVKNLLELAVELEPESAEFHYELGNGYGILVGPTYDSEKIRQLKTKALNEHLKSVELGGKEFVVSKEDTWGFARGPPFDLSIKLYKTILELDNHKVWKRALEAEISSKKFYEKRGWL